MGVEEQNRRRRTERGNKRTEEREREREREKLKEKRKKGFFSFSFSRTLTASAASVRRFFFSPFLSLRSSSSFCVPLLDDLIAPVLKEREERLKKPTPKRRKNQLHRDRDQNRTDKREHSTQHVAGSSSSAPPPAAAGSPTVSGSGRLTGKVE